MYSILFLFWFRRGESASFRVIAMPQLRYFHDSQSLRNMHTIYGGHLNEKKNILKFHYKTQTAQIALNVIISISHKDWQIFNE